MKRVKPKLRKWIVLGTWLLLTVGSCDDCKESQDSCHQLGRQACGFEGFSIVILECREDGLWYRAPIGACPESCVEDELYAICVDDDCDTSQEDFCFDLGSTACDGFTVQECENPEGIRCPVWTDTEDCMASDMVCSVEDGSAACVIPESCTNGATRCSTGNDSVETCTDNAWTATETCNQEQVCRVLGDTAQCVAAGDSCTADQAFDQRCNPEDAVWIQECWNAGTEEAPQYEWRNIVDCSLGSADHICIDDPIMSLPICGLP